MLTAKQRETYEFVRAGIKAGRAPTYRQIAAAMGSSPGIAYASVSCVCARGWLKRQDGQIVLTRQPSATVAEWDYFAVDYEHLTDTGWPRLVDLAPA